MDSWGQTGRPLQQRFKAWPHESDGEWRPQFHLLPRVSTSPWLLCASVPVHTGRSHSLPCGAAVGGQGSEMSGMWKVSSAHQLSSSVIDVCHRTFTELSAEDLAMNRTQTLHWALHCLMGSSHVHGSFYVSQMVAGIIIEIQAGLSHEEETESTCRVLGTRPKGGGALRVSMGIAEDFCTGRVVL